MKKRKSSASSSLLRFVPENYIKKIKFNPKQIEEHLNEDIWVLIMEFLTAQEVLLTMMLVSKKLFQYAHEVPLKLDVRFSKTSNLFNTSNVKHISSIKIRADIPSRDAPCLFNRFIDEQLTNDVIFEANKLMNSDKILGLTSITLSPNFTCAIQSMFKDNSKLKNLKELTICQGCFYPKTYESILQNSNLTNIESVTLDFNEKKCGRCESSISVTSLAQSPIFKNARSFHILYGDVFRDNEIMELLHSPNFQNINNITLECDDGLTIKTIQTLASSNLDIHYLKIAAPSDYTSNSLLEAATNAKPFRNLHTLSILFQYCDPIQNATFMKFVKQGPQRNIKCLELFLQEVDNHVINCIVREPKFQNIERLALYFDSEIIDLDSMIAWTKWKPKKLSFFGTSCCRFISEEEFNIFLDHLELSTWRSKLKKFHLDFVPSECLARLHSVLFHSIVTEKYYDSD